MLRFVLLRLAGGVAVIFSVATICFFLLHAAPGGPFDRERALPKEVKAANEQRYHLNEPMLKQYGRYMSSIVHGDLGPSFKRQTTVNQLIADHFPYSATIGVMGIGFAIIFGVLMGVVAAWRRNTWVDYVLMTLALVGISIPSFVLGPLLVGFFSLKLGWFPPIRAEGLSSFILPSLTLGLIYTGTIARLTRGGMLETLHQDFIRTARAKGLSERVVVWKHALKLGIVPVLTYLGPAVAALISGSFIVEKIFQIPGLGFYFVASITDRDYNVLTGVFVFYVAILVVLNLVVDIVHGLLDPRIREGH